MQRYKKPPMFQRKGYIYSTKEVIQFNHANVRKTLKKKVGGAFILKKHSENLLVAFFTVQVISRNIFQIYPAMVVSSWTPPQQ